MRQQSVDAGAGRSSHLHARDVSHGLARGLHAVTWFGVVGLLLAGKRCLAQDPPVPPEHARYISQQSPPAARLTLRPREAATGTQTVRAGWYELDRLDAHSLDSLGLDSLTGRAPLIYAPQQCVGTRRCPLFVTMGGIDRDWLVPMADKYGILLFVPGGYPSINEQWVRYLDAYLRQALRRLAVDPDKLATMGHCGGGANAFWFGRTNMHVFSRVISGSPEFYTEIDAAEPKAGAAEFLLIASMDDPEVQMYYFWLKQARHLRREGLPVKQVLSLRPHAHRLEEFDLMGRWLQESWAHPGRTGHPDPRLVARADSLPLLTLDAVGRLATFWTSFTQEPESVWVAGLLRPTIVKDSATDAALAEFQRKLGPLALRLQMLQSALHPDTAAIQALVAEIQNEAQKFGNEAQKTMQNIPGADETPQPQKLLPNPAALLKEAILPVGQERVTVLISDFPALAAKYPSVAAKLQAAGLTAGQAEAYRLALLSARATLHAAKVAPGMAGSVAPSSVLGRNMAFLEAHPDALKGLLPGRADDFPEDSSMLTNP